MTNATLNIGLAIPESADTNSIETCLDALREYGIEIHAYTLEESDTEQTLVVDVQAEDLFTKVLGVSDTLKQDCIAALLRDNNDLPLAGVLIGALADSWGEFEPAYFIQSKHLPKAVKFVTLENFK